MKKLKPYFGAGIIFWMKDEHGELFVLLGKRSVNPGKGKWSIPGGRWEKWKDGYDCFNNHNFEQTAIRESWEEVGLSVDERDKLTPLWSRRFFLFNVIIYSYQLPKQIKSVRYQEFSEVKWFPANSIPKPHVIFVRRQVAILKKRYS
jgi:8-oxo-dGTP pyrophosphatase MutT (NUDIX family)